MDSSYSGVTVIISEGLLVEGVLDEHGEWIGNDVIDLSAWEGGQCPFCGSCNVEHVGGKVEDWTTYDGRKMEVTTGGHMECQDCGCDEDTDPQQYVKSKVNSDVGVLEQTK